MIQDLVEDRRFDVSNDLYRGARSLIVEPLKIANEISGAVLAIHQWPSWFGNAEHVLLETLTRPAAIAIQRDFGLELVHSIGNKMLRATAVDALLKEIVSGAIRLTHTDSGVIYVLSEDGRQVIQSLKSEGAFHPEPRLDNPVGITRTVISNKEILEILDVERDGRVNPELRGKYRSMFAVPLLLGDSVVGVLHLNSKSMRGLTETERALLSTLAGQAALAIQRANADAMYRSLLDHIPQCVFRKDRNSRFIWANESFCKNLGKPLEEVKGKNDFDFYPKELAEQYVYDDQQVMQTKQILNRDEPNQPPGKKMGFVRVVKTRVLDANNQVTGVQAIFWDITQEKQMTYLWQSLVAQSPVAIVVHKECKITLANPAANRLFGYSSVDDLKGLPLLDFIDESCRLQAIERAQKLYKKEAVPPMQELRVRRKTGEVVDVEVYSRPGLGDEVQAVFHDVHAHQDALTRNASPRPAKFQPGQRLPNAPGTVHRRPRGLTRVRHDSGTDSCHGAGPLHPLSDREGIGR